MVRCCSTKQNNAQGSTASKADCKGNWGWSQETTSSPEAHQQGEAQQESWDSGYRNRHKNSEISTYSYLFLLFLQWNRLPSTSQRKDKDWKARFPDLDSQLWEVKGRERERKKLYFIIFSLFLTVGKSVEIRDFSFIKSVTQNMLWWVINKLRLSVKMSCVPL